MTPTTVASTPTAAPALKGIQQARVLRAMLQYASFTRKELAEDLEIDVATVQSVLSRHRDFTEIIEQRHSGGKGAAELVLRVSTEKRDLLIRELEPLYADLQAGWDSTQDLRSYVPGSLEFRVTEELIQRFDDEGTELERKRQMTAADLGRAIELLQTVSRREQIPVETRLAMQPTEESKLDPRRQVAKARTDALKAKLCWLAAGSNEKAMAELFADTPLATGGLYLGSAVQGLRALEIESDAEALEFWGHKQVWSTIVKSFNSLWAAQTIDSLKRGIDAEVLPRLNAAVSPLFQPSPSLIAEGLICAYDHFYGPSQGKTLGFLDLRPSSATFTIIDQKAPRLQVCTLTPSKDRQQSSFDLFKAADEVQSCLAFFRKSDGEPIEELFLAGYDAMDADFKPFVQKLGPRVRIHRMDFPAQGSVEREKNIAKYAAEIGLAVKEYQAIYQVKQHR